MANAGPDGSFNCISDGCNEDFKTHERSISKIGREMVLDIGAKPEVFPSDQTPTPIRLIRNCEEMGLFQDLQNVNPFEETFRKATEDILSGSSKLEMSSLSVSSNTDDSLHTPHVVFPAIGEANKMRSDIIHCEDENLIQPDGDALCLSLETEEPSKTVVQQDADTSEEMQLSDSADGDDKPSHGTIQFLLRMPNGKMVQLSSLPIEDVDNAQTCNKAIPIIKVDSSALKNTLERASSSDSIINTCGESYDNKSISSSGIPTINVGQESVVSLHHSNFMKENSQRTVKAVTNKESIEQATKMSLAKQRLKQALMKNSCPAATPSTSSNSTLDNRHANSVTIMSTASKVVSIRRPSSTSDEGSNRGSDNSFLEEKRRRNRAAAMRCREKRKTWVKELERRANDMLRTNGQLQYEVSLLRDEVAQLKTLLLAHRDCPVTQALVQGPSVLPAGRSTSSIPQARGVKSSCKAQIKEASSQALVIQTPSTAVKPVILLGDPPVKRKRLPTSNKAITSTAPLVSASTVPQTFVISSVPNASSKTATVLSSSFVNVIPSVLMASPTSSSRPNNTASQVITLSSVVPTISPVSATHFAAAQRQPFILPKADIISSSSDEKNIQETKYSRIRSGPIFSTNVIKVNPNVVDRDSESYDSDVEIIDVDITSEFS